MTRGQKIVRAAALPSVLVLAWPLFVASLELTGEGRIAHAGLVLQWTIGAVVIAIINSGLELRRQKRRRDADDRG